LAAVSLPSHTPDHAGAWIPLDEAAVALGLSQQTLWHRLQDLRVDVRSIERDGRQVSALPRTDLPRLASEASPRARGAPQEGTPARGAPPTGFDVAHPQRSLWQQLRELEIQRDQLDFELRIVRTQLTDMRARAQQAEESARDLRAGLADARSDADQWRERFESHRVESSRLAATLGAEIERRESLERQLARLIEIEKARERYCDRLEARLHPLRRLARGA
jgi:DNA repair exonuclease SbcCD ATPase subunit